MEKSDDLAAVRQQIRTEREKRGWSQDHLAELVGTKQQTIDKIESGITKKSSFLPRILTALELSLEPLTKAPKASSRPEPVVEGQFPIHAATAGGKGALVMSDDPVDYLPQRPDPLLRVKGGYGIIVVEDSMSPEFEPGDIALVHPHLPPTVGSTCVFYAKRQDGTVEAMIKRLRRVTGDLWHVRQFNPGDGEKDDFTLKRSEWQTCHVTVGRYSKR